MTDSFSARVNRLARRLRLRRSIRYGRTGLLFGMLPGIALAVTDGTLPLPFAVTPVALLVAAAGMLTGAVVGLLLRVDVRAMLIRADRLLESQELASTAQELVAEGSTSPFAEALITDAARLLARHPASAALGRERSVFTLLLPAAAIVLVLALLFPVDLRPLFAARAQRDADLVLLGQDLQSYGERLLDSARPDSGRGLALSQRLTQLGKELADRTVQGDDALDRISEMEGMVSREYELRMQEALASGAPSVSGGSGAPGTPGSGSSGRNSPGGAPSQTQNGQAPGGTTDAGAGGGLNDLSDLRKALSDARRKLEEGSSGSSKDSASGGSGDGAGAAGGDPGTGSGPDQGPLDGARGSGSLGQAPGTAPSPQGTGAATPIQPGDQKAPERESVPSGEGESARMLVRALPDPTGSRLPDQTVLNGYARQAESALAREEIPHSLRQYVKDYFTVIGMPRAGTGQ